ncbi:MAG: nucleotidyltransferase family protein [Rhizomicrobium sp.]
MNRPITNAMIMAAGLGTRMRPLTLDRPKPLVEVHGKALIDHAIDRLVQAGVTMIVVNVHYRAEMVKAHLARRHDVEIRISEENEMLMGTGGGIVKALPHFGDQPFFVHNSDSVWVEGIGHALERMKALWNPDEMDALLLLASMVTALGFEGSGDFLLDAEGRVARVPEQRLSPFAYPGVQIVHPRIFDNAPEGEFSMNLLWDGAIERGRLYGIRLDGVWIHVGTPEAVKEAEAFLADLAPV